MTLRAKTISIIAVTLLGLLAALFVTSQVIVMGGFAREENQEAREDAERVQSALMDNMNSLAGTTRDWASWDDTYAYISDHNSEYAASNLSGTSSFLSSNL